MTSTSGKQDIKNNNEITCNLKSKAEGKKDWLILLFQAEILTWENQVAYLILQVAYLFKNSVKIS